LPRVCAGASKNMAAQRRYTVANNWSGSLVHGVSTLLGEREL